MDLENHEHKIWEKLGEKLGFIFSFVLMTSILYFILSFFHRIPSNWNILHIGLIVLGISILGYGLKKWLE